MRIGNTSIAVTYTATYPWSMKKLFSTIKIPDPRDARKLLEAVVTLYYTGQVVNCSFCHELDHQYKDCRDRPQPKCNLCMMVGHTQRYCPTAHMGPMCFRCKTRGHMSYDCPRGDRRIHPVPMPIAKDRPYRPNRDNIELIKQAVSKTPEQQETAPETQKGPWSSSWSW